MQPFRKHSGLVAPLDRENVDTDQIIPKQFLKSTERTGYKNALFFDWRFGANGNLKSGFVLNQPKYSDASILLAGSNFGCGSSREHAAWALLDYGFRVVIAPSFADIFFNNATKNGILPVVLPGDEVTRLFHQANASSLSVEVDLEECEIRAAGWKARFTLDDFRRRCLLEGLDDIELTLQHEAEISAFEARRPNYLGT